jgi:hypothetical protein
MSKSAITAESGIPMIMVTREFDAPRDLVFRAHTDPDLTSALYLDQRPDVEHYLEVVDQLSGEALTPAESTALIERVARET